MTTSTAHIITLIPRCWYSYSIRRPCDSRDPACETKPLLFWISVEMSSPLSSESVFRGGLGGVGTPRFMYAPLGTFPIQPPLGLSCAPSRLASGALWLTTARHSEREPQKKSFLEPPARLRKGSGCSESSIFIFCKDLTLVPILHPLGTPKWVSALHDGYPGGPFCSI